MFESNLILGKLFETRKKNSNDNWKSEKKS